MPNAYESLHVIKDATTRITEHIDHLKADGLLGPEQAEVQKLTALEIGSVVCSSAMSNMAEREMQSAAELEKTRFELEKSLASKEGKINT